jgi:hypothetical protein
MLFGWSVRVFNGRGQIPVNQPERPNVFEKRIESSVTKHKQTKRRVWNFLRSQRLWVEKIASGDSELEMGSK